jgi:hypothetical protein
VRAKALAYWAGRPVWLRIAVHLLLAAIIVASTDWAIQTYEQDHAANAKKQDRSFYGGPIYLFLRLRFSELWGLIRENHNELLVVVTIALAVFTYYLWVSTKELALEAAGSSKQQAKDMGVSLRIAAKSANAAKTSSDAVMLSERAYLKMAFTLEGVKWNKQTGFEINVLVKNHGRTPATVTDIRLGRELRDPEDLLPEDFTSLIDERVFAPSAFLVPEEDTPFHRYFGIRPESYKAIDEFEKRLWVFGYVDYIDTFGVRHRAGCARQYEPIMNGGAGGNLTSGTLKRYDFDRLRVSGEGNDWGNKQAQSQRNLPPA